MHILLATYWKFGGSSFVYFLEVMWKWLCLLLLLLLLLEIATAAGADHQVKAAPYGGKLMDSPPLVNGPCWNF
jgi:hypothetical protein